MYNEISYLYSVDDQRMYKKVETPTNLLTELYLWGVLNKKGVGFKLTPFYVNDTYKSQQQRHRIFQVIFQCL